MADRKPPMNAVTLESICKVLGDTEKGLTGTEIGFYLANSRIEDTDSGITKWKRLLSAFANWQTKNQCSNHILNFIGRVMAPARYIGKESLFQHRRHELNKALSFIGLELNEAGRFISVERAETISAAEQRASHFKYKLEVRNIHPVVMQFCSAELLTENYFHSVFEAVKSIADRIREKTGLYADGYNLVETAFAIKHPLLRINLLQTETDRSEHRGLENLIKGLFGLIRNPTAHEPKIKFEIDEELALDTMTIVSAVHKRLDKTL